MGAFVARYSDAINSQSMEIKSYITGFIDGEGCFSVSFNLRKKLKNGIEVRPSFSVSQNKRSKKIIFRLKKIFGCGSVRFSAKDDNYKFEVRSINDLTSKIIPFFEKNILQTNKQNDFILFKNVCKTVKSGEHLSKSGLKNIIRQAYKMNAAGKRKFKKDDLLRMTAR